MCWENKTDVEIKEIHKKITETYVKNIKEGLSKLPFDGRPHYNKTACEYIDQLNKKLGWNLQHAENGGEIRIVRYFPDGYDAKRNIVFEYDEPAHYVDIENNILRDKDIERQNYIIEKLGCEFYRYNESLDLFYKVSKQ